MTGSTLGIIIIAIVAVITLAAWLALVFHADAHPAWRRQVPSGPDMTGPVARVTATRHQQTVGYPPGQTQGPPAAGPDAGAPAQQAAGTAVAKARAG